jgi:glycerophosphoryl diester phosphodiesterase
MSLPLSEHFICFAHRGASGTYPENTLLSFSRALELGARWIELDLRIVEGELIVFHDRTLSRRAGVSGSVEKQSLATLRELNVGQGERIPLFSEVLALVKGRARLQVELKGRGTGEVTAHHLNSLLSNGWAPNTFLVSSFDHEEISNFTRIAPTIPVGLLLYGYPLNAVEMARTLKAYSVHLHLETVTPKRVGILHDAGFKVFVYTVNEPADITAMRSIGVDGVFSDFPERVLAE